jgi:four helix bundle protein
MRKQNILRDKSLAFAIRIVKFNYFLMEDKKEYVLSKQILRSGTSIGAQIRESENASSLKDFIHKLSIVLREADETQYWLELLNKSDIISEQVFESLNKDAEELVKLLVASIKTSKSNNKILHSPL